MLMEIQVVSLLFADQRVGFFLFAIFDRLFFFSLEKAWLEGREDQQVQKFFVLKCYFPLTPEYRHKELKYFYTWYLENVYIRGHYNSY